MHRYTVAAAGANKLAKRQKRRILRKNTLARGKIGKMEGQDFSALRAKFTNALKKCIAILSYHGGAKFHRIEMGLCGICKICKGAEGRDANVGSKIRRHLARIMRF